MTGIFGTTTTDSPEIIPKGLVKITPILSAGLGAAASYYAARGLTLFLGVTLIILISLMTAVISCYFEDPKIRYYFRRNKVYLIALYLGFSLGLGAGSSRPIRLGLPEAQVTGIYGILQDDPAALTNNRGMGNLALQSASGLGGIRTSAKGKTPVFFPEGTMPRLKEFGRGSALYIEGNFLVSKEPAGAGRGFRAKAVHIVQPAPRFEQFRTAIRLHLVKRFTGPRWGGLALALLIGARDNLDTEFAKSYKYAGCSHILALSGMHLAIVTAVISFLLKKSLGLKAAGIIGMVCISIYVYLAGNLPSLNRAAIMYILGTLAVLGALPRESASLLAMAFLIQIGIQPESGRSISFILSYLALGGILCIGELIHELIRGKVPEILAQPVSASLGAFIASAGAVVSFFGIVRPIGILAGLIITPLTTFFMIGSMIVLLPGLFKPVGMILSVLYDILEGLAALSAQVPGLSGIPAVPLGLCLLLWNRHQRLRRTFAPFD